MKFHSLALFGALAAVATVFSADTIVESVETSNTFGVLKVTSATENTIVSVPWVECETGNAVKIAKLVKTDNLTNGDQLFVYEGNTWFAYVLENGAWNGVTTVSGSGVPAAAAAAADKALPRGAAIFLHRQNPKTGDTPNSFYLYGQYDSTAVQSTVTAGTAAAPVYNLLASPKDSAFKVSAFSNAAIDSADQIVIPLDSNGVSKTYVRKDGVWGRYVRTNNGGMMQSVFTAASDADEIPAGTGFWYVSKGGAGFTFAW